jgi:hypothetical protein
MARAAHRTTGRHIHQRKTPQCPAKRDYTIDLIATAGTAQRHVPDNNFTVAIATCLDFLNYLSTSKVFCVGCNGVLH